MVIQDIYTHGNQLEPRPQVLGHRDEAIELRCHGITGSVLTPRRGIGCILLDVYEMRHFVTYKPISR